MIPILHNPILFHHFRCKRCDIEECVKTRHVPTMICYKCKSHMQLITSQSIFDRSKQNLIKQFENKYKYQLEYNTQYIKSWKKLYKKIQKINN